MSLQMLIFEAFDNGGYDINDNNGQKLQATCRQNEIRDGTSFHANELMNLNENLRSCEYAIFRVDEIEGDYNCDKSVRLSYLIPSS